MLETRQNEIVFIERIKNFFKKKRKVNTGDLGVFEETLSITSIGNTSRTIHYEVFIKVKCLEVYDNLVEIEVLDVTVGEASEDIRKFIKHENIKYLNPNRVKWQAEKK